MANEIANIAQAGIVLQVFEEVENNPPLILGSWGVIESSLVAVQSEGDNTGLYLVRLEKPGAGVPIILGDGAVLNGFSKLSQMVMWSGSLQGEEFEPEESGKWICGLVVDPDGPTPVAGKTISLPFLAMQIFDEGADSENGLVSVQVIQIPQG